MRRCIRDSVSTASTPLSSNPRYGTGRLAAQRYRLNNEQSAATRERGERVGDR